MLPAALQLMYHPETRRVTVSLSACVGAGASRCSPLFQERIKEKSLLPDGCIMLPFPMHLLPVEKHEIKKEPEAGQLLSLHHREPYLPLYLFPKS